MLPAALFPNWVRLDSCSIHPDFDNLDKIAAGAVGRAALPIHEFGDDSSNELAYDAPDLIFLMLSRLEERGGPVHT